MNEYSKQIERIKIKLLKAKKIDSDFKVFGAKSHKYFINKPILESDIEIFETKYNISLPLCYRTFISEIGNGGNEIENSGAGPFYGIYPLGKNVHELIYNNLEKYLSLDSILYPKMTEENWLKINSKINDNDDINDEEYENELGEIFKGILPIGSQGCTYIHGIILSGKYKGRVVNIDIDRQKPKFTYEANYLDWYERWLDEIISKDLLKENSSWFGYTIGGNPSDLFISADNNKEDYLTGLLNKKKIEKSLIEKIETLISNTNGRIQELLIQIICIHDYERSKPYLIILSKQNPLVFFQYLYWYCKEKSDDWFTEITDNSKKINDSETFRFFTYILLTIKSQQINDHIVPFTEHQDKEIRSRAYYTLGKVKNKKELIDVFVKGLNDSSNKVVHSTLQALSDLKDNRLLFHYKNISKRFPIEKDYILSNLNHRLSDYKLNNKTILNYDLNKENEQKAWYKFWK